MRRLAVLALLLAMSATLAALEPLRVQAGAFYAGAGPLRLVGEEAVSAAAALQQLASARSRGVSLIHLRLDSLPASATPGVPSEAGWRQLDQVLAEAERQGVYVLPSLASFRHGGGAERLAKGLGGQSESLYLADGRARDWYLFLLQSAATRISSLSAKPLRENPALAGWSLASDLDDPEDPRGERALNWALRSAALLKRLDPGRPVGLHVNGQVPAALAAVDDLDFAVLPLILSKSAAAELPRALLFHDPQGHWSAPDPVSAPRLAAPQVLLKGQQLQVEASASEPVRLRVDFGSDGLLARRQDAAAPAKAFSLSLAGLKAGRRLRLRISAVTADGRSAQAPALDREIPGEPQLPPAPMPYSGRIITAHDAKFWDGAKPYRYVGSNNYYIRYIEDPAAVRQVLDAAHDMGLGVLRCQANGDRFEPMQAGLFEPMRHLVAGGPTGFQEDAFKRYDSLMADAAKRGIRVIIYVTDNWEYLGGMKTWVRWRGLQDKNKFFSDPQVKADYKGLLKHWAERRNTVTGLLYKDDPAVFSWELANEPRDEADTSSQELAAWAQEMASYWKGLDPKHMVSVGLEGARAHGGTHYSGSDFEVVQAVPAIDFACFHLYPVKDNLRYSLRAAKGAIRDYVRTAHAKLHKPVVMEEFGVEKKYDGELNRYEWLSGMMEAFVDAGGDGLNNWMLIHDGYNGGDGHEIAPSDTEYMNLFKRLSVKVRGGKP